MIETEILFKKRLEPALAKALHDIFGMMLVADVQLVKTDKASTVENTGVTVSLSMSSPADTLLINARFPKETALNIASKMSQLETTTINGDVRDACLEVVSMVAGNIKKDIADLNYTLSLPSIATSQDAQAQKRSQQIRIWQFMVESEPFEIEILKAS